MCRCGKVSEYRTRGGMGCVRMMQRKTGKGLERQGTRAKGDRARGKLQAPSPYQTHSKMVQCAGQTSSLTPPRRQTFSQDHESPLPWLTKQFLCPIVTLGLKGLGRPGLMNYMFSIYYKIYKLYILYTGLRNLVTELKVWPSSRKKGSTYELHVYPIFSLEFCSLMLQP